MANEVIIEEYQAYDGNLPIPSQPATTQILDIGELASALLPNTKYIRLKSKGVGFWYSFNGDAQANTAGSTWLWPDTFVDHLVSVGASIDTAA